LVEIALGSNVVVVVVVVVPVLVVVVPEPEPLDVLVDAEAVVVFFEPPCAAEPVVFVVVFVVPAPVVFVLDGPCVDVPPPFGVDVPTLGDVVGALLDPAPRPCAAADVLTAATAIAVTARSENLRMLWTPSGWELVQERCLSPLRVEAACAQRLAHDSGRPMVRERVQKPDQAFSSARRATLR
jgi:hypothetical protein